MQSIVPTPGGIHRNYVSRISCPLLHRDERPTIRLTIGPTVALLKPVAMAPRTGPKKKVSPRIIARPRIGSEAAQNTNSAKQKRPAYIVGMGGSAGALEAFEQFFTHMPSDSGF